MMVTTDIRKRFAEATATLGNDDRAAVNALLARAYDMGVEDGRSTAGTLDVMRSALTVEEMRGYLKGTALRRMVNGDNAGAVECLQMLTGGEI